MKKPLHFAMAGVMAAAAVGSANTASASALADDYHLTIRNDAAFTAKFCLLSQGYGSDRATQERCSGERPTWTTTEVSVPRRNDDRIWLNILVQAAGDAKQITIHNGYNYEVNDHVFDTTRCTVMGDLRRWTVKCARKDGGYLTYYNWY